MLPQHSKTHTKLGYIRISCNNGLKLDARISILSLTRRSFSKAFEISLLSVEYLQIISQVLLFHFSLADSDPISNPIHLFVLSIAKLLNPGFLFRFQSGNSSIYYILPVIFVYSILRNAVFAYIVYQAWKDRRPSLMCTHIWKRILKVQSRALCCFIMSFWIVAIQKTYMNSSNIIEAGRVFLLVLFIVLMMSEFIFCLSINARYHMMIPTQSLLSSKDVRIELITLFQKFLLFLLWFLFQNNTGSMVSAYWIFESIKLLFDLICIVYYLRNLPLYNLKGLFYQGRLLMAVISLDITCFVRTAISSASFQEDCSFVLVVWIVLLILAVKLTDAYLSKKVKTLATEPLASRSDLVIHKLSLMNQLGEQQKTSDKSRTKYNYQYVIKLTAAANMNAYLNSLMNISQDLNNPNDQRENYDKMSIAYLEAMITKFSKSGDLIKLYLAELYAAKTKQYGIAMKYLNELQHCSKRIIQQSASVLIWDIQNKLQAECKEEGQEINLSTYFAVQNKIFGLQKKIALQSELQINLYQEMLERSPNLAKIFNYAQVINSRRHEIEKEANVMIKDRPDYYTNPILMYAQYHLISNNSLSQYLRYYKLYTKKRQVYRKHFTSKSLAAENSFEEGTALAIASGQKEDLGNIHFCTNSLGSIYGGDSSFYIGMNISTLAPVNLPNFYPLFGEMNPEKTEKAQLNKMFRGFCKDKKGYVIELDFYIGIFPFLTQGFYYCFLIKQVPMHQDYLIINKNGTILGLTAKLEEKFGLSHKSAKINVESFSEELAQINEIFNYFVLNNQDADTKDKPDILRRKINASTFLSSEYRSHFLQDLVIDEEGQIEINLNQASQLCSIFETEGKDIQIKSFFTEKTGSLSRHVCGCKIKILTHNSEVLKLIALDQRKTSYANQKLAPSQNLEEKSNKRALTIDPKLESARSEMNNEDDFLDFGNQMTEDEKQTGWINFERLESKSPLKLKSSQKREYLATTPLGRNLVTTEANLLPPTSTERSRMNSAVRLLDRDESLKKFEGSTTPIRSSDRKLEQEDASKVSDSRQVEANRLSKISHFERLSQSFDNALSVKTYPRSLKLYFILFYMVLIAMMGSQIGLKLLLDNTVTDLSVKKEILANSQQRDYQLGNLYRFSRVLWNYASGRYERTWTMFFPNPIATYLQLDYRTLNSLAVLNKKIVLDAGSVDESLRNVLFAKDVRIFYSNNNSFANFTTFGATDQIINAGFSAWVAGQRNASRIYEYLEFIFQNGMNDLIIKTEAATNLFLESIQMEVNQIQSIILILMFITVGLLLIVLIPLIYLIIKTCSSEKANMTALVQLDPNEVKILQDDLIDFKNTVESDITIQQDSVLKAYQKHKLLYSNSKRFQNRRFLHSPKTTKMTLKYLLLGSKALFIWGILIFAVVYTSLVVQSQIEMMNTEQTKLYFANGMVKTLNTAYLDFLELFATNNTSYIKNELVSVQFSQAIQDLNTLRNNFLTLFLKDTDSDPLLRVITFGQECSTLVNFTAFDFCGYLKNTGRQISLITLLAECEELLQGKLESFFTSNRTADTLVAIEKYQNDLLLVILRVSLDQSTMVSTRINQVFDSNANQAMSKGQIVISLLASLNIIIATLSWIIVFRPLKETTNQMKNVLKNFPPNLIILNLILKTFLKQISGKSFDPSKFEFNNELG